MKLDQCNEYLVSTVATEGLVLQHLAISSYHADYVPMNLQLFTG